MIAFILDLKHLFQFQIKIPAKEEFYGSKIMAKLTPLDPRRMRTMRNV